MALFSPSLTIRYGEALWSSSDTNHPLIQGVLWERDIIMLLGTEKSGKSILGMQMAFGLTSGTPFLDKYEIPAAVPVLYLQTEGKPAEMVERMTHMKATLAIDDTKFYHLYHRFLPLDTPEIIQALTVEIDALPAPPKVIVVDSLYTSMLGDLSNNKDIRKLFALLSPLLDRYQCAICFIHHETKPTWDDSGHLQDRGDSSSYGSVFLRAWVGHILYLKKHKDKTRTLSCDTQRSGKVLEREDLVLVEPHPLCFEIRDKDQAYVHQVRLLLEHAENGGLTREWLRAHSGLSDSALDKSFRRFEREGILRKDGEKPRHYWLEFK